MTQERVVDEDKDEGEGEGMNRQAPRAFNRAIYDDHRENVFYGTDDGEQDGSFAEFEAFRNHYDNVKPQRKEDIHMISVVGGLYGLNLIPLWKPKKLTFFDINPAAVTYFDIIQKVWVASDSAAQFLQRLTDADYEVEGELAEFVRENIRLRRLDQLPRSRGSTKRTFEESWPIALEHFDLTKEILQSALQPIRTEPMESESFAVYIKAQNNLWIYASNITQFHYFELELDDPSNVVLLQIIHPAQPQLLDLSHFSGVPVRVHFEIPMYAQPLERIAATQKIRVQTNEAAPAIGTYSQAIRFENLVFTSGQTGRDPATGQLEQGLEAQTERTLANLDAILNAAGCRREDILKVTFLMADITDFKAIDQIYAAWLPGDGVTPPKPARTAQEVSKLPAGALIMIEMVAAVPSIE